MNTPCNITIPLNSARELRDLLGRIFKQASEEGVVELSSADYWKLFDKYTHLDLRISSSERESDAMVDDQEYVKETVGI